MRVFRLPAGLGSFAGLELTNKQTRAVNDGFWPAGVLKVTKNFFHAHREPILNYLHSGCRLSENFRAPMPLSAGMDGYTKLAALVGKQPEFAIFPRFQAVRALRLAHLSAEIAQLVHELGIVMQLDRSSEDPENQIYESYYLKLQQSIREPHTAQQLHLWETLSGKLKEHGTQ